MMREMLIIKKRVIYENVVTIYRLNNKDARKTTKVNSRGLKETCIQNRHSSHRRRILERNIRRRGKL